jgi:hypothetical protein
MTVRKNLGRSSGRAQRPGPPSDLLALLAAAVAAAALEAPPARHRLSGGRQVAGHDYQVPGKD